MPISRSIKFEQYRNSITTCSKFNLKFSNLRTIRELLKLRWTTPQRWITNKSARKILLFCARFSADIRFKRFLVIYDICEKAMTWRNTRHFKSMSEKSYFRRLKSYSSFLLLTQFGFLEKGLCYVALLLSYGSFV